MINPLSRLATWYRSRTRLQQVGAQFLAAFLLGLIVVPWFIFMAGRATLSAYGNGGPFALWADFFRGLWEPSLAYWFAAFGPMIVLALWTAWRKLTN